MCKGGKKLLQFLFLFLIFLIFSIILLLALPYHYDLSFNLQDRLNYSFSFSVIFLKLIFEGDIKKQSLFLKTFSYKKEIKLEDNKITSFIENKSKKLIKEKIEQKTSEKKESQGKSKKKSNFKFDFSLINRENLNHIFSFVVEMIRILKIDYLKLNLVFSFDDPYYNGIFLAYYYTLKELFDYPDLKAEINWQEVVFEAEGSTGGKIIPLKIIWQLLQFIFSIKSLKIFWQLYQSNSKKG